MGIRPVLLAPMRAQPLHFGHEYYIHQLSEMGERVIVLLNRKIDVNNPFSFLIRQKWIRGFATSHNLLNILVPDRLSLVREIEYPRQAACSRFIVLTTTETDDLYRGLGFATINHHSVRLPQPQNAESFPGFHLPIADTGRMIRERLRIHKTCAHLMSEVVEREAGSLIRACK